MRLTGIRIGVVTFTLAVGVGLASRVGALDNVFPRGADTMAILVNDVSAACPGSLGYSFLGGGNDRAVAAMQAGTQTVAAMSRPLSDGEICSSNGGATAESLIVALDSLGVVAGAADAGACGSALAHTPLRAFPVLDRSGQAALDCPGCLPGTNSYRVADWRDVLALVYAGVHHDQSRTRDCDSPVRRSLVRTWEHLFQQACADGTCPGGLRRAFRRADLSHSTDAFVDLVGLAPMPDQRNMPNAKAGPIEFCNAHGTGPMFAGQSDMLDNDPIRSRCEDGEQVCGRDGTLGLVLVVEPLSTVTTAVSYPTELCDVGKFPVLAPALFGGPTVCPNGLTKLFNKCFQPVRELPSGEVSPQCIARRFPVQGIGANGMDGRAYNLTVKHANGTYARNNSFEWVTGAYYRLHTTTSRVAGAPPCRREYQEQIECLVGAQGCSIGYARSLVTPPGPGAVNLAIGGITPSTASVQARLSTTTPSDDYPLARPLYLNTLVGFEHPSVQTQEYAFSRCMGDTRLVNTAITTAWQKHQIPVPGSIRCADAASAACPDSLTDACSNNPVDLLTPDDCPDCPVQP